MKNLKKIMAAVLAVMMVGAMSMMAVFAQTATYSGTDKSNGSITILNAAKGETYTVYKLFEARLGSGTGSGTPISYYGDIPSGLTDYFEYIDSGTKNVKYKGSGTEMPTAMRDAIQTWAEGADSLISAVSDGSALKFAELPYGYYVVTTTQGKQVISVDSTQPDVEIYDKNSKTPTADKTVENKSYNIGDRINYTAVFNTANYIGEGKDAKQVINYVINDTLPEFLSDVTIESLVIKTPGSSATSGTVLETVSGAAFSNKQITLPWANKSGSGFQSKYQNGAVIVIKYSGILTQVVKFDGDGNKNTITIEPYGSGTGSGSKIPHSGTWKDDAIVYTYGAALKKIDGATSGTLAGAEFKVNGLIATKSSDGVYVVSKYNPSGTSGTIMKVADNGMLYILGLASGTTLSIEETKAPDGYNKATSPEELKPQVLSKTYIETSGSWKVDEDGNRTANSGTAVTKTSGSYTDLEAQSLKFVNNKGSLLPSTGGIGTTIFYVVGAVLVIGSGIVLVTKKRMGKEEN